MNSIFKQTIKIPLLSLLIVAGIGFSQFHEVIHVAGNVQFPAESNSGDSSSDQFEDDCLACTLTITAASAAGLAAQCVNYANQILSFSNSIQPELRANSCAQLRAPPIV